MNEDANVGMTIAVVRQRHNPCGGAERVIDRALGALAQEGAEVRKAIARYFSYPPARGRATGHQALARRRQRFRAADALRAQPKCRARSLGPRSAQHLVHGLLVESTDEPALPVALDALRALGQSRVAHLSLGARSQQPIALYRELLGWPDSSSAIAGVGE